MDFLIVGFLGFCAGFFCAALFSANKCGECKAERMEAERERDNMKVIPYEMKKGD